MGALVKSCGLRMVGDEALRFAFVQSVDFFAVDDGHEFGYKLSVSRRREDGAEPCFYQLGPIGDWQCGAAKAVAVAALGVEMKFGGDFGVF